MYRVIKSLLKHIDRFNIGAKRIFQSKFISLGFQKYISMNFGKMVLQRQQELIINRIILNGLGRIDSRL